MIPVLRRREVALILSRLLQPRVALPGDHAAIAFLDVGVGFAGRADHSYVSKAFLRIYEICASTSINFPETFASL
jgi:hypothetical protein